MTSSLIDKIHRQKIRVYYEDTDFSGAVFYANYLRYAERGRTDFLRSCGVTNRDLAQTSCGVFLVVAKMNIIFKCPAMMDDLLDVLTVFHSPLGARLCAVQVILRDGELVWRGESVIACINKALRPTRLPKKLLSALQPHMGTDSSLGEWS